MFYISSKSQIFFQNQQLNYWNQYICSFILINKLLLFVQLMFSEFSIDRIFVGFVIFFKYMKKLTSWLTLIWKIW